MQCPQLLPPSRARAARSGAPPRESQAPALTDRPDRSHRSDIRTLPRTHRDCYCHSSGSSHRMHRETARSDNFRHDHTCRLPDHKRYPADFHLPASMRAVPSEYADDRPLPLPQSETSIPEGYFRWFRTMPYLQFPNICKIHLLPDSEMYFQTYRLYCDFRQRNSHTRA